MSKTLTVFSKTTGCQQCVMTKRKLTDLGVIDQVEIIYIDKPENAALLEGFKREGLTQAPIVTANFPVTINGQSVDHWTGFQPEALTQAATILKENN